MEVLGSTADRGGESRRDRPLSLRPVAVRVVSPFSAFCSDPLRSVTGGSSACVQRDRSSLNDIRRLSRNECSVTDAVVTVRQ